MLFIYFFFSQRNTYPPSTYQNAKKSILINLILNNYIFKQEYQQIMFLTQIYFCIPEIFKTNDFF